MLPESVDGSTAKGVNLLITETQRVIDGAVDRWTNLVTNLVDPIVLTGPDSLRTRNRCIRRGMTGPFEYVALPLVSNREKQVATIEVTLGFQGEHEGQERYYLMSALKYLPTGLSDSKRPRRTGILTRLPNQTSSLHFIVQAYKGGEHGLEATFPDREITETEFINAMRITAKKYQDSLDGNHINEANEAIRQVG